MRAILTPVIAAVSFAALPALAQTTSTSSNTSIPAAAQNSSLSANQMEQKLQTDLAKAGYTDIKVMPGSFLVSAKDSEGQATQMMITPPSVIEMTAMQPNTGSGSSAGSGSTSNSTPKK